MTGMVCRSWRVFAAFFAGLLAPAHVVMAQAPQELVAAHVMTKNRGVRVEASVAKGLDWLAREQNTKGFWEGLVGTKRRESYRGSRPIQEQRRAGTGHLGVTALCGMAFLSGGHLPGRGKYGEVVKKAVTAVLYCIQESGLITVAGSRMYSHAFATLFLAEVYGMSLDKSIKSGLERATHMIVDCQNPGGGWRYTPFTRELDLSVTVCQLQALRAARNIGIRIPKSVIDNAVAYVRRCRITSGYATGRYYYSTGRRNRRKQDHYSIQAAAVTSLVSAGVYDRELIEPVMEFLEEEMPRLAEEYPHHYFFWYGNYYASQAFFHADRAFGSRRFQRYYNEISRHLIGDQEPDGRWLNSEYEGPGDAFGTAVACIILQIPNQYLPIFQR